jgi:molybdate transport system substrate-binding protein
MRIIFICLLFLTNVSLGQDIVRIAAASDLKFALDSVIASFQKHHDVKVDVTYGSSGKLSEQIAHGAPFDIFFSADIAYPEGLKTQKKTSSEVYPYAKGRIVLWSKKHDVSKQGMKIFNDPAISKIAIANPKHAPYGKRALEALEFYKIARQIENKFVYGENISQAAQFVSSGAADIGIIALSLALSPNMKSHGGNFYLIPEDSHQPLIQGAVVTTHGKENKTAISFFNFIQTREAIAILSKYGFTKPDQ